MLFKNVSYRLQHRILFHRLFYFQLNLNFYPALFHHIKKSENKVIFLTFARCVHTLGSSVCRRNMGKKKEIFPLNLGFFLSFFGEGECVVIELFFPK